MSRSICLLSARRHLREGGYHEKGRCLIDCSLLVETSSEVYALSTIANDCSLGAGACTFSKAHLVLSCLSSIPCVTQGRPTLHDRYHEHSGTRGGQRCKHSRNLSHMRRESSSISAQQVRTCLQAGADRTPAVQNCLRHA